MQRSTSDFWTLLHRRFLNAVTSVNIADFRLVVGVPSPGVSRRLINCRHVTKDETLYKTVRSCYSSRRSFTRVTFVLEARKARFLKAREQSFNDKSMMTLSRFTG
jgi:hypothetical protein